MQTQANPYDSTQEEQELAMLQKELSDSINSAEANFAKFMADNTSPELEELFFNDKVAFYAKVLQMQNEFVAQLDPKFARAQELGGTIEKKKSFAQVNNAEREFLSKHPDADINALMDFYVNELRPREQAELNNLPPAEFFERLYEMYKAQGAPQNAKALPTQLNGVNVEAGQAQSYDELPTERI